ncbi:MAG: hypothetical protein WBF73_35375, partial [Bradyrhizobium sp.]
RVDDAKKGLTLRGPLQKPRVQGKKAHEHSHHRFTELVRPSLRNGFDGLYVLLCPQNLPECANGRL